LTIETREQSSVLTRATIHVILKRDFLMGPIKKKVAVFFGEKQKARKKHTNGTT